MKTPRELLLEKHRAAEAKLALIRGADLAALARERAVRANLASRLAGAFSAAFANCWREAIRPWRYAWTGFAVAWVGILALHFATIEHPATISSHRAARPDPGVQTLLAEQKQLFTDLLAPADPPPATRRPGHGPRSGLRRDPFNV